MAAERDGKRDANCGLKTRKSREQKEWKEKSAEEKSAKEKIWRRRF